MHTPPIVSSEEWEAARQKLPVKEKDLTRAHDALASQRRRMPWMPVGKDHRFEGGCVSIVEAHETRQRRTP